MRVGLLVLDLYLHGCQSLKEKRRVIRSLSDGVRSRHNVAAAEVDYQDLHQRARLAFASVSSSDDALTRLFDRIVDEAERLVPGGVSETGRDILG